MAKKVDENNLQPTPLPMRGRKSGNLEISTTRSKDKRKPAIPKPEYKQISLRVPPDTRMAFDDAFEASGIDTKVAFMAAMLECWNKHGGADQADQSSRPSAADIASERTSELKTWVRPDLAKALTLASQKRGRSVGEVLEPIVGHYLHHKRQEAAQSTTEAA